MIYKLLKGTSSYKNWSEKSHYEGSISSQIKGLTEHPTTKKAIYNLQFSFILQFNNPTN